MALGLIESILLAFPGVKPFRKESYAGYFAYGDEGAAPATSATPSAAVGAALSSCSGCYKAKSDAYKKCQEISASDHTSRKSCFDTADVILASCLQGCSSASGGSAALKTAAVLGGAYALYKLFV